MTMLFKFCFAVMVGVIGCMDLNAQNSGDVVLRFNGNDVQITGDEQDNAVRVSVMPAGNMAIVQVEGLYGTTVNGRSMVSRAIANLDDLRFNFSEGTNRILVENYDAQTTHSDIQVTGSGFDFVSIEDSSARSIDINGATFVSCDSNVLSNDCHIQTTGMDDTVLVDSRDTEGLTIETFDGHDVIEVEGDIWGDVNIVSGIDSKYNAYIDSDVVTLTDLQCFNLTVSTGSGNDRIKCVEDNYWFGVQGPALFDGGKGWDFLHLNKIFQRELGASNNFSNAPTFNEEYSYDNVEFVYGELPDNHGPVVTGGW